MLREAKLPPPAPMSEIFSHRSKIKGDYAYFHPEVTDLECALQSCTNPQDPIKPDEARWFILNQRPDYEKMQKTLDEAVRTLYSRNKTLIVASIHETNQASFALRIRGCRLGGFIYDPHVVAPPLQGVLTTEPQ